MFLLKILWSFFACLLEVLFYHVIECVNNTRFDICRIGQIIPYYFALSLFIVIIIIIICAGVYPLGFLYNSRGKTSFHSGFLKQARTSPFLNDIVGDVEIWYFSVKNKLQLFNPLLYDFAWSISDQCMIGFFM